jgi:ParB family chromosome partitioning protein
VQTLEDEMEIAISDIHIGKRFRRDMGDVRSLADSIAQIGLLHPIVIDGKKKLVCGARRIEAFKLLGRDKIPVTTVERLNALLGERDENTIRKDFLPSEINSLGKAIEEIEGPKAMERQRAGKKPSAKLAQGSGRVRELAARATGVGHATYAKIRAVSDAAESDPEKFGDLPAKMDRTGKVDGAYKEMQERSRPNQRNSYEPPDLIDVMTTWTNQLRHWTKQLEEVQPYKDYIDEYPKIASEYRRAITDLVEELKNVFY